MQISRALRLAGPALAVATGIGIYSSTILAADYKPADDAALVKALPTSKHTLAEVIREVSKGGEVPIEAKLELDGAKLMIGAYTSVKGLAIDAENNSFKEYNGAATDAAWKPETEVFTDFKHIARSAQYHALLSMTKVGIPAIIQKASTQGTVLSVKEKIRGGKPVFEVTIVQGNTIKPMFYDLASGEPTAG